MDVTNTNTKEISTGDLIFKVVTKILWFVLAVGVAFILYRESWAFFFETMEFGSPLWELVSAIISFSGGTVFNWLYDGAF